jgi:hypothetical protein
MVHPHWTDRPSFSKGIRMFDKYRKDVQEELNEFCRYLAPSFPKLQMRHAFDVDNLDSDWKDGLKCRAWQESGVYLAFDIDGKLCYVGKATATFNKRIKRPIVDASTVEVIPFPDEYLFMADALESFLISRLQPPGNGHGKQKCFPQPPTI